MTIRTYLIFQGMFLATIGAAFAWGGRVGSVVFGGCLMFMALLWPKEKE